MFDLRSTLMVMAPLVLQAGFGFDPVKDVPISVSDGVLTVAVPQGVHLKTRIFRVFLASRGTLRLDILPPANGWDEAGDPIWRGIVNMGLKGADLEDPVRLVITYQPCTEGPDGMCFLPVRRTLTVPVVEIPVEAR
jgi:hypothetical protein